MERLRVWKCLRNRLLREHRAWGMVFWEDYVRWVGAVDRT